MNDGSKWPKWRDMEGSGKFVTLVFWFFVFMAANEVRQWLK